MACCIITAYVMNRLIKGLEIFDLNLIEIRYNEFDDPESNEHLLPRSTRSLRLRIGGMTCTACATQIQTKLLKLKGVERASVSLSLQRATLVYDSDRVAAHDIEEAIRQVGYQATAGERSSDENLEILLRTEQLQKLRSAFTSAVFISSLLVFIESAHNFVSSKSTTYDLALFLIKACLGGWVHFYDARWIHKSAWGSVGVSVHVNMDFLISLSLMLGFGLSLFNIALQGCQSTQTYFTTGSFLTVVILAGRYLDLTLKRSGASNFINLYRLQAETSLVQVSSNECYVPATLLRKDEAIVLEPMSIVPCDCYILKGSTLIDEATMTGELIPTTKCVGDFLMSGTRNLSSRIVAVVTAEQADSSLERMIQSISAATEREIDDRSRFETITDHFIVAILLLASASFAQSFLGTGLPLIVKINTAAQRAMTVLAAACPCALGLAVPSATMAAIQAAWSRGALLTGGERTLNNLATATHVVMDKTGTLTEGRLEVTHCRLSGRFDKNLCHHLLYLVEKEVAQLHPAGRAVFQWALRQLELISCGLDHDSCLEDYQNVVGSGVSCFVTYKDGTSYALQVGSRQFLEEGGVSWANVERPDEPNSPSIVHFAINNEYAGNLTLQEKIRDEAPEVIRNLKSRGLEVSMLTGDTRETAARVSTALGIPVLADRSLPHEKQAWIQSLQKTGSRVIMIGDGMNDILARTSADVGILLSLSRAQMTSTADVVILSPDLRILPKLFEMAAVSTRKAALNIRWAMVYNTITISLALGLFERWGLSIDVSLAGMLMTFSSLFILVTGLQLRRQLDKI